MNEFLGKREPVRIVRIQGTPDRHTGKITESPEPVNPPEGMPQRGAIVTLKDSTKKDQPKEKFKVVDFEDLGGRSDDRYRYHLRAQGSDLRNVVAYPSEIEEAED